MTLLAPRSLLWRLGLVLMLAQLVIAVALGGYAHRRAREFHLERTADGLDRATALLVHRYGPLVNTGDPAAIEPVVGRDGRRGRLRITVILDDGRVIADSEADPAGMDDHRHRPEIDAAFRTGAGTSTRYSATLGVSMLYLARAVPGEDPPAAVIRTALPMTRVDAELARLTRIVGIAGVLSILLTLAVIYLVSRHFSGQVSRLAAGAAHYTAGDLTHRIAQPPASELSALAELLNEMAAQLHARIEQLESQQHEQDAILQSMRNGVIAICSEQRILNLNRAAEQMLGVDVDAARGRLLQEVIREPDLHQFVADAMAVRSLGPQELTLRHERQVSVQAFGESLIDAAGRPRGLLVILNDVTQLRRYESLRSDFAANVSHELRTPITNIKGYAETLQEVGWDDREQADRFLEIIRANGSRLAAIVEDVMALTKLEEPRSRESLDREPACLSAIVGSVIGLYEPAAAAKDMTVRSEVPPDLEARIHRPMIEQAVGNLLSNAISYAPTGTAVTISAAARNGELEIAVADEGPGIPADKLPRLFERFFRVDKARSRELGGTGLGLAIVKHIALVHGGRVDVESTPGRGSVFRMILPRS